MSYCYINGQIIEEAIAKIPVTNLGIQRGFGIFDLFRSRNGKPTFMEDYLDRFERSQAFLNFRSKISKDEIREAVADLQRKNKFENSTFKLMLLADGLESDEQFDPYFYIINAPVSPEDQLLEGGVITHDYLREYPEIKTINYMTSYMLHQKKKKANSIDVIYYNDGIVTEASRSNVFIVSEGELITPEHNILHGITRKQLLTFSPVEVSIGNVTIDELRSADEVFVTSTLKEVLPITQIDGNPVGDGKIGPITKKLQSAFNDYLQSI